jgi:DNA-binding LacI/PurR family transcriptional regulator
VSNRRMTRIGFLTDWLESSYQLIVLRGVVDAARERDTRTICYVTGVPGAELQGVTPIHCIVGPDSVDGLIVIAPSIAHQSEAERERFLQSLRRLPVCSVALELPAESAVLVDNDSGLADAVNHLVKAHGYRRIGFLRGPEHSAEAQQRLAVYCAMLAEHGLVVDERLIVPGDFTVEAGERAASTLFDARRVSVREVDAVVAANDGMALGFMDALWTRGIRVPSQVAVVGFDDAATSRRARVALTTVRQPLYELGQEAVRLLLARIDGAPPERSLLRTQLVTRRSCGCLEGIGRLTLTQEDLVRRGGRSFEVALLERREHMLNEMRQAARGQLTVLGRGWELRLVAALVDELKGVSPDAFRLALDDALSRAAAVRSDPAVFHEVVSALWRNLIPCVMGDRGLRTMVEGLLDGARLAIGATEGRARSAEHRLSELLAATLVNTGTALCTSSSLQEIGAVIESAFSSLGISQLAIALYEDGQLGDAMVRVLLLHGGKVELEPVRLQARELPDGAFPGPIRATLIVSALHSKADLFGIVCMDLAAPTGLVHEAVRESLSAALHAVRNRGGLPSIAP